jgi:dephospho-CoA kinase
MQQTGWPNVHFGNTVVDEVRARDLEVNQANEKIVREEFRTKHGMGALALMNLPRIRDHFAQGSVILESFYSWEEYVIVKKEFGSQFFVLAVHASFPVRAKRMEHRPERPLTAPELEMRDTTQIETLHQAGPIARADFMIINEGTREELYQNIDTILSRLIPNS